MPDPNQSWEQVFDLVADALEIPTGEREQFLANSGCDPSVIAEAASLIEAAESGSNAQLLEGTLEVIAPAPVIDAGDSWAGRRLGAYEILKEVGRGGMGTVFQARRADDLYDRVVAIKVIHASLSGEDFIRRFRRETRILARLQHPAVVALLDAGATEDHEPWLAMEFVDGLPIHQYVDRERLNLAQVVKLIITLCDALSHAHAQGVIHRDVKPSNVLVSQTGQLKLLDFGVARLSDGLPDAADVTLTNFRAITPAYASPEQMRGSEVTVRSDIYSVGVLMYMLLTGAPPYRFTGLSAAEIERTVRTQQPELASRSKSGRFAASATEPLDAIIGRAMDPDPARRYESPAELKAELLRILAEERPRTSRWRFRVARWWQRWRTRTAIGAAATALLAVLIMTGIWLHHSNTPSKSTLEHKLAIAVIPVPGSMSGAKGSSWSGISVQEALNDELASGDQLRVISADTVAGAMRELHAGGIVQLSLEEKVRVARNLGADYLVEETTAAGHDSGSVRIEVTLDRVGNATQVWQQAVDARMSEIETATQHLAISIARVLPLKQQVVPAPSLLPRSPEAVRAYAEGLEHLRALDPLPAKAAFERAVKIEPRSPLIHAALAKTWNLLGYKQACSQEAERAISLSEGLPVRTRLAIEAQANELRQQWPQAIDAYRTLRDYDPDDVEYVLGMARAQAGAGKGGDALKTLKAAEQMPSLLGADPRLELLASTVEEKLGHHTEALQSADAVLSAAQQREATQLMAQAQRARASALESLGRVEDGITAARLAGELFARAGDAHGEAISLIASANFLEDQSRFPEAKSSYMRAKEMFTQTGDEAQQATAENDLGIIADDVGNPAEALVHYTEALKTFRRVGDAQRIPLELNNIGTIEKELGQLEAAKRDYTEALNLSRPLGDPNRIAREYTNLGTILIQQGELDKAQENFNDAYQIYSKSGQTRSLYFALSGMGHVAWNQGRLGDAHARYQEALHNAQKLGDAKQESQLLRVDAHVLHDAGNEAEARQELGESERLRAASGQAVALGESKLSAVLFDVDEEKAVQPESRLADLLKLFEAQKEKSDAADTQLAWSESLSSEGKIREASAQLRSASLALRALHADDLEEHFLVASARLANKQGQLEKAQELLQKALVNSKRSRNVPDQIRIYLEIARIPLPQTRERLLSLTRYSHEAAAHGFTAIAARINTLRDAKTTASMTVIRHIPSMQRPPA